MRGLLHTGIVAKGKLPVATSAFIQAEHALQVFLSLLCAGLHDAPIHEAQPDLLQFLPSIYGGKVVENLTIHRIFDGGSEKFSSRKIAATIIIEKGPSLNRKR